MIRNFNYVYFFKEGSQDAYGVFRDSNFRLYSTGLLMTKKGEILFLNL